MAALGQKDGPGHARQIVRAEKIEPLAHPCRSKRAILLADRPLRKSEPQARARGYLREFRSEAPLRTVLTPMSAAERIGFVKEGE